ncbi:hypothetical protein [Mesorhizobium sp. L-2-11]|uniref:hypothetical protein n=1 Tax=Mesorhizobium sp. L-2-11 TaxID=2744521 RepID=UPI0019258B25|nr:hypothetical protein [Mesorhizobium sp. L-2-11]BCH20154.1 hypothetical protein MesoLjLa_70050 [Mesorhizobium sp. L-2-11]
MTPTNETPAPTMEPTGERKGAELAGLIDRLNGIYRIPITDGLGAVGAGEEPENPNEFVRKFETPPIHREAAAALTALQAENEKLLGTIDDMWTQFDRLRDATNRRKCGQAFMVGGRHIAPWGIVDHAISALDLSMMREDRIDHERKRAERAEAELAAERNALGHEIEIKQGLVTRLRELEAEQARWTNAVVIGAPGAAPLEHNATPGTSA